MVEELWKEKKILLPCFTKKSLEVANGKNYKSLFNLPVEPRLYAAEDEFLGKKFFPDRARWAALGLDLGCTEKEFFWLRSARVHARIKKIFSQSGLPTMLVGRRLRGEKACFVIRQRDDIDALKKQTFIDKSRIFCVAPHRASVDGGARRADFLRHVAEMELGAACLTFLVYSSDVLGEISKTPPYQDANVAFLEAVISQTLTTQNIRFF